MKKLHIFIASLLAMSSVWTTAQTVHTIGDSTMADYNEPINEVGDRCSSNFSMKP